MQKLFVIFLILFLNMQVNVKASVVNSLKKDIIIKNRLFSIELPQEFKGFYKVEKNRNGISIYHKASKKAGFGGYAFGVTGYKNPADYAGGPAAKKIGELKDKRGVLYDIVLTHPTDVQYDYIKNPEPPKIFKNLYDLGNVVNIQGVNGSVYYKNQGMNGENLYKEVLAKHKTAIIEKWDFKKLKQENMSYMYSIVPQSKIGYIYYDVNVDGIEELIIGEISEGNHKGIIYDIYTMVDRRPQHVISANKEEKYYICDNSFICNEHSSNVNENEIRIYSLEENSTKLYSQVSFKYDDLKNPKNPYFISYADNKWENFSEEEFNERKKVFEKYERFNFIPLLNYKISKNH